LKIVGRLKDDIASGQLVIFLGAGSSKAAGLDDSVELSKRLFKATGTLPELLPYQSDLARLVARLDENPAFVRGWVNKKLKEYFLDYSNYRTLESHELILHLRLRAIFTTNFDSCLELAESRIKERHNRIVRVVYGDDEAAIYNEDPGKLKYFKLHGCCRELDEHPGSAPNLVLTRKDFREAGSRNANFMDAIRQYSYSCSIVFIGFRADRPENDHILGNIIEAYQQISASFPKEPFKPFAVLPDISADDERDITDSGLTPLRGSFDDFIHSAYDTSLILKKKEVIRWMAWKHLHVGFNPQ